MKRWLTTIVLGSSLLMAPAAFAADATTTTDPVLSPVITTDDSSLTDPVSTSADSGKMTAAERQAWKSALAPKQEQLKSLRQQVKDLRGKLKAETQLNKDARHSLQGSLSKEQKQTLKTSLQPNAEQRKALHEELKNLQGQRKQAVEALKAARSAHDLNAAQAALDQLINLEQQLLDKGNQLLTVKGSIHDILTNAAQPAPVQWAAANQQ
ncbi:hypothetical protein GJ688_07255 [Heliobacillus mobilis]|uniref:Uncharacterized protein n=1 Tax=Heliobacterium mobile TaxID=28064 RepID=A0A6I3SJK3_HELMO|nr:hypothetical protein [Heliobacterium mobile]MTV48777.1 hypothetical protein [Heliobacterium mobile]